MSSVSCSNDDRLSTPCQPTEPATFLPNLFSPLFSLVTAVITKGHETEKPEQDLSPSQSPEDRSFRQWCRDIVRRHKRDKPLAPSPSIKQSLLAIAKTSCTSSPFLPSASCPSHPYTSRRVHYQTRLTETSSINVHRVKSSPRVHSTVRAYSVLFPRSTPYSLSLSLPHHFPTFLSVHHSLTRLP